MGIPDLLRLSRDRVFLMVSRRALDRLAGSRLDEDAAIPNGNREHVHGPRRGTGDDLTVAIADRTVTRTIEAASGLHSIFGLVIRPPRNRAAQAPALLPQRQEV